MEPEALRWHRLSQSTKLRLCWWLLLFHILTSSVGAVGQTDGIMITQADFQALVAFKHALQDPRNTLRSWNETGSGACSGSWVGVKCVQGQVIAIQLPGKGLGGRIATEVGQLVALRKLNLHSNFIQGQIPPSLAFLQNLRGLYLFQNLLSGSIPDGFAMSPVLQALDLSRNQLSGSIPASFARSPKLFRLDFSFNNLTGRIPPSLASLAGLIDLRLSNNLLQGSIPSELGKLPSLLALDLSFNQLNGSFPSSVLNISSLTVLNVAHNHITGPLPKEINRLKRLHVLNVGSNKLEGIVPPEIGSITGLALLDISGNIFSGSLPSAFSGLTNLTSFNCSNNNLSGPVPAILRKFNKSSFAGNVGICGLTAAAPCASPPPPLAQAGNTPNETGGRKRKRRFSTVSLVFIIIGSVIAGLLLLCFLVAILWFCGSRKKAAPVKQGASVEKSSSQSSGKETGEIGGKLVHFEGSLNFSADDLLCATAEVLGKSTYGTVYKATLEDGNQVAVKRLREGIVKSQREFEVEVTALGTTRHPNLLSLRAYYWGPKDEKLLVYDFMPGGSLAASLHARGPETPMDWQTRMNIAAGTARGLAYLHRHQKIIHGNLTASNILLDSHMNAKLSDFGLSRLMTTAANSNVIATASALGYRAPELSKLRKATAKADVYSFGIVLLELLTGKAPGENASGESGMDLPEWVASTVKEEWTNEIFDVELMKGAAPSEDELINSLQLAMSCVNVSPSSRPEMEVVVHQLEEIKPDIRVSSSA